MDWLSQIVLFGGVVALLFGLTYLQRYYFQKSKLSLLSSHATLFTILGTVATWATVGVMIIPRLVKEGSPTGHIELPSTGTPDTTLPHSGPRDETFKYEYDPEAYEREKLEELQTLREAEREGAGEDHPIGLFKNDRSANAEEAAIELSLIGLTKGQIAFDVPPQMREGRMDKVEVRIAKGVQQAVTESLKRNLRGTVQVDQIDVASFMVVKLESDSAAFAINPLTDEKQIVTATGFNTWAWNVKALEPGQQTLYLSVGTRFKFRGKDEETKFMPLYSKAINVHVDRLYEGKRFVSGNWQWLIASLLIPLVGILLPKLKRKPHETELEP